MGGRRMTPIRDAATIVLLRRAPNPAVLMGQRGAQAVFMPGKFVFPGGRIDAEDHGRLTLADLDPRSAALLAADAAPDLAPALVAGALRELQEETGLRLTHGPRDLRFFFRAITPPGRPRRFDARFFLADADAVAGDPDDFTAAGDELSFLQWVELGAARELDLPFITEIVLGELVDRIADPAAEARPVPFFDNSGVVSRFRTIDLSDDA